MIAFVEAAPQIDLKGEHFTVTLNSGGEAAQFLLTAKAFFGLRAACEGAYAERRMADLELQKKLLPFSKATRPKGKGKC